MEQGSSVIKTAVGLIITLIVVSVVIATFLMVSQFSNENTKNLGVDTPDTLVLDSDYIHGSDVKSYVVKGFEVKISGSTVTMSDLSSIRSSNLYKVVLIEDQRVEVEPQ